MSEKCLQQFSDIIKGETVYIIGGGPSLKGFDFERLNGKITIAINSAMYFLQPTAVFWCDGRWAAQNDDKLSALDCFKLGVVTTANPPADNTRNRYTLGRSLPLYRTGTEGYDATLYRVRGNNSGTMAINMCCNMQAKRIILLGFDVGVVDKQSHFHANLQDRIGDQVYINDFLPNFKSLHAGLIANGVKTEILNASSISRLEMFTKINLDDYI
jgi:hypothetical protein